MISETVKGWGDELRKALNVEEVIDTVDLEAGTVDGLSGADEAGVIEALKEEAIESVDVAEFSSSLRPIDLSNPDEAHEAYQANTD